MSDRTYYRMRTPGGTGVTVRTTSNEVRLSVGSAQRMVCSGDAAWTLWRLLAVALLAGGGKAPGFIDDEVKVSDR